MSSFPLASSELTTAATEPVAGGETEPSAATGGGDGDPSSEDGAGATASTAKGLSKEEDETAGNEQQPTRQ